VKKLFIIFLLPFLALINCFAEDAKDASMKLIVRENRQLRLAV